MLYLDNDPCHHCQHYSEYYDRHTGITDCDCGSGYDFHEDFGKVPCPHFAPILPSDWLMWQLADEEEARFWAEQDSQGDKNEI